ncbi:MAG: ABC transporter ATP-binding protein [Gordonibacter sp.]|nr:ABC transporter ATP-binding protein [Gordonibacter sp.]
MHGWIVKAVGSGGWLVATLCLVQGLIALNAVAFALVMRQAIDQAVAGNAAEFWLAVGLFGGLLTLQVTLRALNRFAEEGARALLDNRLRQRALHAVLVQDYRTSSVRHSGEVTSRMTSDVTIVSDGVASFVPSVVSLAIRLLGAFGALFVLAPVLAAVFACAGVVLALVSIPARRLFRPLHLWVQETESTVRCFVQECLESLVVVHSFGCEDKVERTHARNQERHRKARMRRSAVSSASNAGLSLALQGGYLLGFVWCGAGLLQGSMTYGTMMAVIQLVGQVQSPFTTMGGAFSRYSAMLASAERLRDLEEDTVAITKEAASAHGEEGMLPCVEERVVGWREGADNTRSETTEGLATRDVLCGGFESFGLDCVSFGYDSMRHILQSCSFQVRAGEIVGLTGESGSGKSTAMLLLMGLYQPKTGSAYVCVASKRYSASAFACLPSGMFAYVPQGNCLMSGTIREVVSFAERGPCSDDARVEYACRVACAWQFVSALPDGLDTVLGERGAGLSEGQMQRLAIARAVYSSAPILLLDEATSALDQQTEQHLLKNMKILANRTILIVTHRTEALRLCDRVIRLEGGAQKATSGCGKDSYREASDV